MKPKDLVKLIPNQVRITRHVTYEVLWNEDFPKDKKQLGECRSNPNQIVINRNQSDTEAWKTMLHEVLHAVSFENKDLKLTENQVRILEDSLFRVLKLNGVFDLINKK